MSDATYADIVLDPTEGTWMSESNQVVASFPDYAEAQRAVDLRRRRRFVDQRRAVRVVGLKSYEQTPGRRGYRHAGLGGMGSGAVVGLLVGWLLGVFTLVEPLVPAIMLGLWGVVIGGVIGANAGLVGHALTGGRRDFSSSKTLRAQRYDLVADAEVAVKARRLLTDARVVSPGAG